ncbi:transposase domain-containing protein [Caulobacter sp. DWP3-1-3b2]
MNPEAYLAEVITRIADHSAKNIDDLLPWNWQPRDRAAAEAA